MEVGTKIKLKVSIVVTVSSFEYEDIHSIIDELGCEANYDISSTGCVTVHDMEWIDTELL